MRNKKSIVIFSFLLLLFNNRTIPLAFCFTAEYNGIMHRKGFGLIVIIIAVAVITVLGGGGLYYREMQQQRSLARIGKEKEQETQRLKEQIEKRFEQISPSSSPSSTPVQSATPASSSARMKSGNEIMEKTRQLLISLGKLPTPSTVKDVNNYVLRPLQGRPLIYYCGDRFILQQFGGEYHKLEHYSSQTFRKINECEATFSIGNPQPNPPSCTVGDSCLRVEDFVYPLTLKTDKSSYKYGEEITITLASNKNRNETIELVGLVTPYCAGISLEERIGKSSSDWIQDSISRPGSGSGAGCPHRIVISPSSPYQIKIRIDDTGTVAPGKWRIVHKSDFATLNTRFFLQPLNQEHFSCHVSGGKYVGCPENPTQIMGVCIPCACPEETLWSPTEKQCLKTTSVPSGYDANRIEVKYRVGTDVSNPLALLPKNLQSDVVSIGQLAPAGGSEFRWLRIDLKVAADESVFITQLRSLEWVELAEFASLPTPPS